jgi:hypothetical protein
MKASILLIKTGMKLLLIALYIGCLYKMPYLYYQLVRFLSFVSLSFFIYHDYKDEYYLGMFIGIIGLILYNPFFPIHFRRVTWNNLDKTSALITAIWAFSEIGLYPTFEERPKTGSSIIAVYWLKKVCKYAFYIILSGFTIWYFLDGIIHDRDIF